jgi:poly-gamma-glutamate synthesis protein (capsule biosynthesis protein)
MSTRIAFLGDTLLGGKAQPLLDQHGYDYPLAGIRHLWEDADLVVANHEAPITTRTRRAAKADTGKQRYWYKADPAGAHTLAAHGIRVVSLANNHVADFGTKGVVDTMDALDAAGITHCGAGRSDTAARRPAIAEVNGLRVGFLSVMQRYDMYVAEDLYAHRGNPGPARLRMSRLGPDIEALRPQVDLCVVLVHWGRNYREITSLQERLADEITAVGPDLVVGHHPHIAQRAEVINGVPVLFSLGNAAFGTQGRFGDTHPPYGLVAVVDVEPHRAARVELTAILVDNTVVGYQPRPGTDLAARRFAEQLLDERLRG